MPHASGSAVYATFGGVVITGDQRSIDWSETIKTIDVTAGSDLDEDHVTGTRSGTIKMSILYNGADGSAAEQALHVGASGTLQWGPEGTAAGKPKYTCVATVTDNNDSGPYDGELMFDVDFLKKGGWIDNWKHSGSTW